MPVQTGRMDIKIEGMDIIREAGDECVYVESHTICRQAKEQDDDIDLAAKQA